MPERNALSVSEQAKQLTAELETAFEGLKQAMKSFSKAQAEAANLLDDQEAIPKPPEGLDEEMNDLYNLWERTPDAEAVQRAIDKY